MKSFSKKAVVYFAVFAVCLIVVILIIRNRIADFKYPNPEIEIIEDAVSDVEKVIIQQGDILILTLNNTKLSEKDTDEIIRELKRVMNIGRCMPGEFYEILYDKKTGNWTEFSYYPEGVSYYSITRSSDNVITTEKKKLETTITERKEQGTITSSLWSAMASQDVSQDIILSFTDIFAWQIDFLTDTKQGDIFKLMYEVEYIAKKNKKLTSRIIVAQYQTSSRTYNAFYFKTKKGEEGYFDENGKSIKSAFLKAPLQFRRISSFFATSRVHPILKYARPHLGIDYAAPKGTPVSSVGNGTIAKAQCSGGFGNLVIIKHSNGYETYYGHLSKYGKGIKKGAKVKQGQVIGYVGMTGLATGPHLDFRIKLNGKFFDFRKMKRPPLTTLTGEDKKAFMEKIQTIELI
jgi:murein DD-endopeptidase MepM/ murein hydrolase activator NlpD